MKFFGTSPPTVTKPNCDLLSLTVCGLSDLPDPSEDAFFNNLASFPIFGEDIGNFDPNDTDAMIGFQKPAAMANMSSRAETARLLKVVGGVGAQPGEIR